MYAHRKKLSFVTAFVLIHFAIAIVTSFLPHFIGKINIYSSTGFNDYSSAIRKSTKRHSTLTLIKYAFPLPICNAFL